MTLRIPVLGAALLALTTAALVWAAGSYLTKPVPARFGAPPDSATVLTFESASGSRISGWHFPVEGTRAVAVLLHGIRSNRGQMVRRAEHLRTLGIASLAIDFQAHGESPGQLITLGHLESLDARAAIERMTVEHPGLPVLVIGVSMGGAAALLAEPALDIDALVLESVYPDVMTAIANRLRERIPGGHRLSPLLAWQIAPRAGIDASDLSPVAEAHRVSAPTLVLSGDRDTHTTVADTVRLHDALPEPKALAIIAGAGHEDLERFDPVGYWELVEPFIEAHLASDG